MGLDAVIRERVTAGLAPVHLEVINESARHAGHAGDDGSGESHWRLVIRSEAFAGQTRIARHRAVHAALGDVMERIHALALDLDTP